jgi:hypothetical protein
MSDPKPRYNAYAETVAPLVDARQESMVARPANQQAIEGLLAMLRERWPGILRRGWHGAISIEIIIRDGMIEQDMQMSERRSCRLRD